MESEKRLIDANALMKYINEKHSYSGLPMAAHICTMELLTYAPTVDAVEVVHGQWLKAKDGFDIDRGWKCSSCNNYVYAMTYEPYEYCPHCGAMMNRERKDNA